MSKVSEFLPGMTRDDKILAWAKNAELLKAVKNVEMAQRKEIFGDIFPDPKTGTNTLDLGAGYKLKAVHGYETKLEATTFALLQPEIEKLGDAAKAELAEAVKFTPALVAKGYKAMSEEVKELFDECLVTKPKSVSMELVVPKKLD